MKNGGTEKGIDFGTFGTPPGGLPKRKKRIQNGATKAEARKKNSRQRRQKSDNKDNPKTKEQDAETGTRRRKNMTKQEYTTWAEATQPSEETLKKARDSKQRGIGNWAEFYAEREVEAYAATQGDQKHNEDQDDLWERLMKAIWALLQATSEVTPEDENRPEHGGSYEFLGGQNDYPETQKAALEILAVTHEQQARNRHNDWINEKTKEAARILAQKIKDRIEAEEANAKEEATEAEKEATRRYLDAKAEAEEARENAEKAEEEARGKKESYSEVVSDYNYILSDLYELTEEDTPRDARERSRPDTYTIDDLKYKAEEVEDAIYAWEEAEEEAEDARKAAEEAEAKEEEAEDDLNDAIATAGLEGRHDDPEARKQALIHAAKEGEF